MTTYIDVGEFGILPENLASENTVGAIALQAAVQQAGDGITLVFDAGKYLFDVRTTPGNLHPLQFTNVSNLAILGKGKEATILKRYPLGNYNHFGDIHLIYFNQIRGGGVHNITLDGSYGEFVNPTPNQHVHNLYLTGCKDIDVYNMISKKAVGDGLYMINHGTTSTLTEHIRVKGVRFEENKRAGVANQRGLRDVLLYDCRFIGNHLDIEPSGGPSIDGYVVDHCIFEGMDGLAIQAGGNHDYFLRNFQLLNSRIDVGGLWIISAEDVLIDNLTLLNRFPGEVGAILRGYLKNLTLTNSHIQANADYIDENGQLKTKSSAVSVYVGGYNEATDIKISDNLIEQKGKATGVSVESSSQVTVQENRVQGIGYGSGISVMYFYEDGIPRRRMRVHNNIVEGFAKGIAWGRRNVPLKTCATTKNTVTNCETGIYINRIPENVIKVEDNEFDGVANPVVYDSA